MENSENSINEELSFQNILESAIESKSTTNSRLQLPTYSSTSFNKVRRVLKRRRTKRSYVPSTLQDVSNSTNRKRPRQNVEEIQNFLLKEEQDGGDRYRKAPKEALCVLENMSE